MPCFLALAALLGPLILGGWLGRNPKARGFLLLMALGIFGFGCFALIDSFILWRALNSGYTCSLPDNSPGQHLITLRPIPYEEMEIALRPKAGQRIPDRFKSRESTFVYDWTLKGTAGHLKGPASGAHAEHPAEDYLISLWVLEGSKIIGDLTLEYQVPAEAAPDLRLMELRVEHSAGSRHMLRDHGIVILLPMGVVSTAWGTLWLVIAIRRMAKAKKTPMTPAGVGDPLANA